MSETGQPTASAGRFLTIYLQDHYSASAAGLDLARRLVRENQGSAYADELSPLVAAIASDRKQLAEIMGLLEVKPSPIKVVLARTGERIARLKPNGRLSSYSPLSRLTELETLFLGITGKRGLWRSLETARKTRATLAEFDLDRLISDADAQLELVERLRLTAAAEALP